MSFFIYWNVLNENEQLTYVVIIKFISQQFTARSAHIREYISTV